MGITIFGGRYTSAVRGRVAEFSAELDALELSVAGRFARGNLALQSECILTVDQLEAEREELRKKLSAA